MVMDWDDVPLPYWSEFAKEKGKEMKKRRKGKLGKKRTEKERENVSVCVLFFFFPF